LNKKAKSKIDLKSLKLFSFFFNYFTSKNQ